MAQPIACVGGAINLTNQLQYLGNLFENSHSFFSLLLFQFHLVMLVMQKSNFCDESYINHNISCFSLKMPVTMS